MLNLDFGSGYNPKEGYLTCDFTSNPSLDYYCINNVIMTKDLKRCEPNTFDKIFCRNVLHHIENLEEILKELFRVLKIGGTIEIIEPNKESYSKNYFLDLLWYRGINQRPDIWFSEKYRDLRPILSYLFPKIGYSKIEEKECFLCEKESDTL